MAYKENRPIEPWTNRAEKRQSLKFRKFESVGTLIPVFKGFIESQEQELLIDKSIRQQQMALIGFVNGVDTEARHFDLAGVSLEQALVPLNGELSEYQLSCFDQGKLVRQLIYDADKEAIKVLSDFFYYRHTQGGEGIISVTHNQSNDGVVEALYQKPLAQPEFDTRDKRADLDALVLTKLGQNKIEVQTQKVSKKNGLNKYEYSTFEDDEEVARSVEWNTDDGKRVAAFVFSAADEAGALLKLRNIDESKQFDEQWIFNVTDLVRIDYSHLLRHLMTCKSQPSWNRELALALHLIKEGGVFTADINGKPQKSIPAVSRNGQKLPEEQVITFPMDAANFLVVYFDAVGTVEELELVNSR